MAQNRNINVNAYSTQMPLHMYKLP